MKIPCEQCICLAICINKKEIRCTILLKVLNKANKILYHPAWSDFLQYMCTILRGSWCAVGTNNEYYKVQKGRKVDSSW